MSTYPGDRAKRVGDRIDTEANSSGVTILDKFGNPVAYFDNNGNLILIGTSQVSGANLGIGKQGTTAFVFNVPTGYSYFFNFNGGRQFSIDSTGKFDYYKSIATAGLGVPAIYASSIQNQSNAAPTTVSYTPPATAGTYRITANLEITTGTTITFKNKLTYTSASGAATTDRPVWERQNSATILAEPTANTADRFVMEPYQFTIDNSAGAIALADDAGTYTTCAYRLGVILEQLA